MLGTILFFCSDSSNRSNRVISDWSPSWWGKYGITQLWISPHQAKELSESMLQSNGNETHLHNLTSKGGNPKIVKVSVHDYSPSLYLVEYPEEYNFIINEPTRCERLKPFLVLVVPVAPQNRAHRDVVRSTWGGQNLVQGKVVVLFFLLGQHSGEGVSQIQEQVLQESQEHGDLIQSNFLDCYKNLTIKTMVMLEWLDLFCSNASYAMKIDSDMFLNVPNLINMLLNAPKSNYMTGQVEQGAVVHRNPDSKWYLPEGLYPYSVYPRYALGLGYVLSLDLPKKLVKASRHVTALYLEDVYLGLCLQYLGIPPTDPPDLGYFNVFPVTYSRCAYSRVIATTTHENADRMWTWKDFHRPGPYCS